MTLATGQVLQNRYRIVSLLGQGGMGAVYRAWDTRLNVPVALKEMTPQPGLAPYHLVQLRQQFQQEAMVLARLHHPHLVRIGDFFEYEGNAYLVMDFVAGESLADLIEREGALPEPQVLEWAGQLLEALAYCHAEGIIHRDIKPQNVVIRPSGQAVLVDFGLVKLWDPQDPRTKTAMRGMGTPEYAPPEQYDTDAGHTDPRSDVYSLGATLYHALTGCPPPTATQRIASRSVFQPPRALNPGISKTTEAAVLRAMALTVEDRFATAEDMAAALGGKPGPARQVLPKRQRRPTQVTPGAKPEVQPRKRGPVWAWALGGLAVVALTVGVVGGMWGRAGPPPAALTTEAPTEAPAVELPASPTATPTETPTTTASPTRTPQPTVTPLTAPTQTPKPTITPPAAPTQTPKPTATPTPTPIGTSEPTEPPVSAPTSTPRPTFTSPTEPAGASGNITPGQAVTDPSGDTSAAHIDVLVFSSSLEGETLVVTFQLRDVPPSLTFNKNGVAENDVEYSWKVDVDLDNNAQTGNSQGMEYRLSATHFVFEPDATVTEPIEREVQVNTWIYEGESYKYYEKATIEVDAQADTITLRGTIPGITTASRLYFETFDKLVGYDRPG